MITLLTELLTSGTAAHAVAGVLLLGAGAVFALCGTALARIDIAEHRLPNRIVYPWAAITAGVVLIVSFLLADPSALARSLAAGLGWGLLFVLTRIIVPSSVGLGDAKLAVVLGMYTGFLGWQAFFTGVVLSFILGGAVSLLLMLTGRAGPRARLAFGPFLILGAALALILS